MRSFLVSTDDSSMSPTKCVPSLRFSFTPNFVFRYFSSVLGLRFSPAVCVMDFRGFLRKFCAFVLLFGNMGSETTLGQKSAEWNLAPPSWNPQKEV